MSEQHCQRDLRLTVTNSLSTLLRRSRGLYFGKSSGLTRVLFEGSTRESNRSFTKLDKYPKERPQPQPKNTLHRIYE